MSSKSIHRTNKPMIKRQSSQNLPKITVTDSLESKHENHLADCQTQILYLQNLHRTAKELMVLYENVLDDFKNKADQKSAENIHNQRISSEFSSIQNEYNESNIILKKTKKDLATIAERVTLAKGILDSFLSKVSVHRTKHKKRVDKLSTTIHIREKTQDEAF